MWWALRQWLWWYHFCHNIVMTTEKSGLPRAEITSYKNMVTFVILSSNLIGRIQWKFTLKHLLKTALLKLKVPRVSMSITATRKKINNTNIINIDKSNQILTLKISHFTLAARFGPKINKIILLLKYCKSDRVLHCREPKIPSS